MSKIIIRDVTTPRRVYEARMQQNRALSGVREMCEDSVCPCDAYAHDQKAFQLCKQTCFTSNTKAITDCCTGQCPPNATDCVNACNNPLQYSTGDPSLSGVTTLSKTAHNPGCVIM